MTTRLSLDDLSLVSGDHHLQHGGPFRGQEIKKRSLKSEEASCDNGNHPTSPRPERSTWKVCRGVKVHAQFELLPQAVLSLRMQPSAPS